MIKLFDYPIEHIGYVVKDLGKTVEYLKRLYGIEKFKFYDFCPNIAWSNGEEVYDYKLKIAMTEVTDGKTGFEIIQPISEGIHKQMVDSGIKGINHIAFKVDNYNYWRDYFKRKGANFIFESETEDEINGYRRCFYIKDEEESFIYEIKENNIFR